MFSMHFFAQGRPLGSRRKRETSSCVVGFLIFSNFKTSAVETKSYVCSMIYLCRRGTNIFSLLSLRPPLLSNQKFPNDLFVPLPFLSVNLYHFLFGFCWSTNRDRDRNDKFLCGDDEPSIDVRVYTCQSVTLRLFRLKVRHLIVEEIFY